MATLNLARRWSTLTTQRPLCFLLFSVLQGVLCAAPMTVPDATKRMHPSKPEADGLRLEVTAELEDTMTSDGKDWKWGGAFLRVDIALLNVSDTPVTVPTTAYDEKPSLSPGGPGLERVWINIEAAEFEKRPTVFVPARYTPVVLGPGERVLILRHRATVPDRQRADTTKEIYAVFKVARNFDGPKDWWRGQLQVYSEIKRRMDPDQFIAKARTNSERYQAQKTAEQDPNYGKANAARVAALIAGSEAAIIRGEMEKKTAEVTLRDADWIRQVSVAVANTSLPKSVACLCIGWRTAYFYKGDQLAVSVAAIHGNQLRIHWADGGGDYPIEEAHWQAVRQSLEFAQKPADVPVH